MSVETKVKTIKDIVELKQVIAESPNGFPDGVMIPTEDGQFIIISNKPIRVDHLNTVDPLNLNLPKIGYRPTTDRAILMAVNRQTQFTPEGMMAPESIKVTVHSNNGQKNESVRKQRYFIVECGEQFSKMATGYNDSYTKEQICLERGDEVILAAHLDGLPSFPTIDDTTGIVVTTCISLHYTEIVGYVKWSKEIAGQAVKEYDEIEYFKEGVSIYKTCLQSATGVEMRRAIAANSRGRVKGADRVALVRYDGTVDVDSDDERGKQLLEEIKDLV